MYQIRYLLKLIVLSTAVFIFLRQLDWCGCVITLALALLAYKLADIVIKISWHILPRKNISVLHDKAILITGCDSGFGNKLARKLDAKGVTVFAGCLFPEGPGALQLKNDCSERLTVLHLDVTKNEHIEDAYQTITETLGPKKLWAVVNNAGVLVCSEIEFVSMETVTKALEGNTLGGMKITQKFLPLLRRSKGRIVFTCSVAVYTSPPTNIIYAMTKAALESYIEGLRREMMKWSITVHSIEPIGYITGMANMENVVICLREEWYKAPESLRAEYGDDKYEEEIEKGLCTMLKSAKPASKIHEVVDCMVDASIGQNPKMQYFTDLAGEIIGWILINIPTELFDIILHRFAPKPIKTQ